MDRVSTTVSFMRCCTNTLRCEQPTGSCQTGWAGGGWFARTLAVFVATLLLLAGLQSPAQAQAQTVQVEGLQLHKAEEGLQLSAALSFDLPPPVEEALRKGISIVFVSQADIIKERWYWTDKQVSSTKRSVRLSYQPLTSRWRIQVTAGGSTEVGLVQSFDNLPSALAVIRRLHRQKIVDWQDLDLDTKYTIEFRFRLDTTQLPRPFQIGALQSPDWNLGATRTLRFVHDGKLEANK